MTKNHFSSSSGARTGFFFSPSEFGAEFAFYKFNICIALCKLHCRNPHSSTLTTPSGLPVGVTHIRLFLAATNTTSIF